MSNSISKVKDTNFKWNNDDYNWFNQSEKINSYLNLKVKKPSRKKYRCDLRNFFCFIHKNNKISDIDSFIQDPRKLDKNDRIDYEDSLKNLISEYWIYINEHEIFKGKGAFSFISTIKKFLGHNNITFPDEFWSDMRKNSNSNTAITNFKVFEPHELIKVFSDCDTQSLAMFGLMVTSGLSIENIVNLEWDDIDLNYEYPRIFVHKQKRKKPIRTRTTPEVKQFLLNYKDQYNKYTILRKERSVTNPIKQIDSLKIFPMSKTNAIRIWRNITNKLGFWKLDKITRRPLYGTHSLRRYFISYWKGNVNDAYYLAGKTCENYSTYRRLNDRQLDELYIKGSENLFIFQNQDKSIIKLEEFEEKQNEYENRIKDLEEKLQIKNDYIDIKNLRIDGLKDDIENTNNKLEDFEKRFSTLEQALTPYSDLYHGKFQPSFKLIRETKVLPDKTINAIEETLPKTLEQFRLNAEKQGKTIDKYMSEIFQSGEAIKISTQIVKDTFSKKSKK